MSTLRLSCCVYCLFQAFKAVSVRTAGLTSTVYMCVNGACYSQTTSRYVPSIRLVTFSFIYGTVWYLCQPHVQYIRWHHFHLIHNHISVAQRLIYTFANWHFLTTANKLQCLHTSLSVFASCVRNVLCAARWQGARLCCGALLRFGTVLRSHFRYTRELIHFC